MGYNFLEITVPQAFALVGLVGGSFVATNLDNLLLLVMMLGANSQRRLPVLIGFVASCIAVLVACALGLALSSFFDPAVLGYLGLAPLLLGCHMLYQLHRGRHMDDDLPDVSTSAPVQYTWFAAFVMLFSNSGDSVAVFIPLFAESARTPIVVLAVTYLLIAAAWGALAYAIAGREMLARKIERRAERLVPWVMIGVGLYILSDTATDTLVRGL